MTADVYAGADFLSVRFENSRPIHQVDRLNFTTRLVVVLLRHSTRTVWIETARVSQNGNAKLVCVYIALDRFVDNCVLAGRYAYHYLITRVCRVVVDGQRRQRRTTLDSHVDKLRSARQRCLSTGLDL